MEKIVPMDTRQSMLDDPSKGSKHTTYLPWGKRKQDDIALGMHKMGNWKVMWKIYYFFLGV